MAHQDAVFRTTDTASIALLRSLRAGAHVHFVHHVDVNSAPPADLVAHLEPVPGTDVTDDGYNSVWYCYCAKGFKNNRGDGRGHRERAVSGGSMTCWHPERSPEDVQGSGGGTSCNLSYGRSKEGSTRSFDRMGWCMVEYDDKTTTSPSNYVLCKVYRSSRAKNKSQSSSSSSSCCSSSSSSTKKKKVSSSKTAKRKAGGDHPEAPPTKLIQQQQQDTAAYRPMTPWYQYQAQPQVGSVNPATIGADQQQQELAVQQAGPVEEQHGGDFNFYMEDFNLSMDDFNNTNYFLETMLRDEPEQELQQRQQPTIPEEFIQIPGGLVVPVVSQATFKDMLGPAPGPETTTTMYGEYAPMSLSSYTEG